MSGNILIYGAGGLGRELAYALSLDKNPGTAWKLQGFIDDTEDLWGKRINDVPVLGGYEYLRNYSGNIAVTIVDDPTIRHNLVSRIKENVNIKFPIIISPLSIVSPFVEMGEGCIVSVVQNFISTNVKMSDFVFINSGTRVGHDVEVGDYTTIFSGIDISGYVSIGKGCVIGSGVTILPKVKIGDGSIIGAGSVVTKDIPPKVIAVGLPAKIIRDI